MAPPDGLSWAVILVLTGGASLVLFLGDRLVTVVTRNAPAAPDRDV